MESDTSGNQILNIDSLQINNQVVLDNALNLNVATVNSNKYKIGGQIILDGNLNLNVCSVETIQINSSSILTDIIDGNQYKIAGKSFLDSDLNLNVNSLVSNDLTAENIIATSIIVSGKTLIDDKRNFNASNVTAFNVNTSSIFINGKPCIDKSLNINASKLNSQSLFVNDLQIIDTSGNFVGNMYTGSHILPNIKLSHLLNVTSDIQSQIDSKSSKYDLSGNVYDYALNSSLNLKAPSNNATFTGLTQIEKILEKITPITLSGTTYTLNYSTISSNTLYCDSISSGDLTLNVTNLAVTGSGSITLTVLVNTTTNKKYFKTVQLNGVTQQMVGINGSNNLIIDTNATLVLQQFTFVYINSSLLKIIASLSSLL